MAAIQNDAGYREVRESLAKQYSINEREPNIQVYNVDKDGDRTLHLKHYIHNGMPLAKPDEVIRHLHALWGYDIVLESIDTDGKVHITYKL